MDNDLAQTNTQSINNGCVVTPTTYSISYCFRCGGSLDASYRCMRCGWSMIDPPLPPPSLLPKPSLEPTLETRITNLEILVSQIAAALLRHENNDANGQLGKA